MNTAIGSNNRDVRIRNYREIHTIVSGTINPDTAQGTCPRRVNDYISILHEFIIWVFTQCTFIKIQSQSNVNAAVLRIALLGKNECAALLNVFGGFSSTNFFDTTVFQPHPFPGVWYLKWQFFIETMDFIAHLLIIRDSHIFPL